MTEYQTLMFLNMSDDGEGGCRGKEKGRGSGGEGERRGRERDRGEVTPGLWRTHEQQTHVRCWMDGKFQMAITSLKK